MYEYTNQSHVAARRSSSWHQLQEGSQIERGTSPVEPEIRLLTKITCRYPQRSLSITIKWLRVLTPSNVADRVTRQYSKSFTTHATHGSSEASDFTFPSRSPLSQPDGVYNRSSSDIVVFAGSWTDSWHQDTTSETMELLVPSDQRHCDRYHHHHHMLDRRTCYQDDQHLPRSYINGHFVTSEVSRTSGAYKHREHVEHYEQHRSASVHTRQQTRSRPPRPSTYENGRLRRVERQQIDTEEHRVRHNCVKYQGDAACRCSSNPQTTRASKS
jgi:hypothetical protein